MKKKVLLIILVILLAAGSAVGYFAFFGNNKKDTSQNTLSLEKISDKAMISPVISNAGDSVWYGNAEGEIYRMDINKQEVTQYPSPKFPQKPLIEILWPASGEDFIAFGFSPTGLIYDYFNSKDKIYVPLPASVQSLDWMPDSERIALIWKNADGTGQLVISNSDGTGYKKVSALPWSDLVVKVSPDGEHALLFREFSADPVNKIYLFDLNDGTYTTPVEDGNNIAADWVSDDQFIFLQKGDGDYPELLHYDLSKAISTDLMIKTTLDRLAVDRKNMKVYAVSNLEAGMEEIREVDMKTLKNKLYYSLPVNTRTKRLLEAFGKVYFIKTQDNNLYIVD